MDAAFGLMCDVERRKMAATDEHALLFVATVAIIPFVIIAAVAPTRPLSDTVIVALISLVVSAGGVTKLACIEPNRELEKKDELKKKLHAALL